MTTDTLQRIEESGVVAVLRGADPESVLDIANALYDGGVTAFEVTADAQDFDEMIADLDAAFDQDDVVVGAGTVLDAGTARTAIRAGSEFVVGPTFDAGVVEACNRYGVVVAPGIMTPTEAQQAYEAGADLCKVFPASSLGPGHLSSIGGPLPQIPLMPTGGISAENAAEYVEAGAVAVGAGSALVPDEAVESEDWAQITRRAEELVATVENARK